MAIPKVTPTQAELDSTTRGGKHRADKHGAKHAHHGKHRAKHHHKHHGTWNDKHWRWVPTEDGDWRPGLHLPPQTQAAEAPLPRPRAEAAAPRRRRRWHPCRPRRGRGRRRTPLWRLRG